MEGWRSVIDNGGVGSGLCGRKVFEVTVSNNSLVGPEDDSPRSRTVPGTRVLGIFGLGTTLKSYNFVRRSCRSRVS